MAVSENKSRITISLEKELLKHMKERAKNNGRTLSDEIAIVFKKLKETEKYE